MLFLIGFIFLLIFMLKLNGPFRNQETFIISLFSIVHIWVLSVKHWFLKIFVDILPLGSGCVDPHIFADPDPRSQNLADSTDPDFNTILPRKHQVYSCWKPLKERTEKKIYSVQSFLKLHPLLITLYKSIGKFIELFFHF